MRFMSGLYKPLEVVKSLSSDKNCHFRAKIAQAPFKCLGQLELHWSYDVTR
jgi:hypothetical protein